MRTLKYAILGLINRKPLTGYDITKEFNEGLVNFWYAKHSQIYPELKKLTDEGLISYETVIQGEKLEKKLYNITAEGKTALKNWLSKDEPLEPTPKDIFRLKAYFCDEIDSEIVLNLFFSQLEKRKEKLKILEEYISNICDIDDISSPKFGDYIVLKGAILREKSYIEWLEFCINKIEISKQNI